MARPISCTTATSARPTGSRSAMPATSSTRIATAKAPPAISHAPTRPGYVKLQEPAPISAAPTAALVPMIRGRSTRARRAGSHHQWPRASVSTPTRTAPPTNAAWPPASSAHRWSMNRRAEGAAPSRRKPSPNHTAVMRPIPGRMWRNAPANRAGDSTTIDPMTAKHTTAPNPVSPPPARSTSASAGDHHTSATSPTSAPIPPHTTSGRAAARTIRRRRNPPASTGDAPPTQRHPPRSAQRDEKAVGSSTAAAAPVRHRPPSAPTGMAQRAGSRVGTRYRRRPPRSAPPLRCPLRPM